MSRLYNYDVFLFYAMGTVQVSFRIWGYFNPERALGLAGAVSLSRQYLHCNSAMAATGTTGPAHRELLASWFPRSLRIDRMAYLGRYNPTWAGWSGRSTRPLLLLRFDHGIEFETDTHTESRLSQAALQYQPRRKPTSVSRIPVALSRANRSGVAPGATPCNFAILQPGHFGLLVAFPVLPMSGDTRWQRGTRPSQRSSDKAAGGGAPELGPHRGPFCFWKEGRISSRAGFRRLSGGQCANLGPRTGGKDAKTGICKRP